MAMGLRRAHEPASGRRGETQIAVERDRHVVIATNAILDRVRFLRAMQERLPGIDMFGFVKVAVGDERQIFQSDGREDIVAIGDFPGVEKRGKFVLVFPEIQSVLAPFTLHDVRMRRHGEAVLGVDVLDDLRQIEGRIDRRFQIEAQEVRRGLSGVAVLVELQAGHDKHSILTPGAPAFLLDDLEILPHLILSQAEVGQFGQFADPAC